MILIGIAGPKRSGKTTLANELCHWLRLEHHSFAAPIRGFVAGLCGMTLEQLEDAKEQPIGWLDGATPRQMMQTLGTEWGRQMVHSELWVRSLIARVPAAGAVVSDVRFANEARAIRDAGGIVFAIERPGCGQGDDHASEQPLPDELIDCRIINDCEIADMASSALLELTERGLL